MTDRPTENGPAPQSPAAPPAAPQPPCPECGSPRTVTASQPPWPIRRRLLIQLIALACGLGFWAYKMAETWPTLPAPTVRGPGITSAEFPLKRFTRRDLEAYAAGERADGKLLDVFNQEVHDTAIGIEAALISPAGYHQDGTSHYGWPYPVYSWRKSATYSDVYALTDPSTSAIGLVDTWIGWAHVRVRIDEVGRRERSAFTPERSLASFLVIFAVWLLVRLGIIAIGRLRLGSKRLRLIAPMLAGLAATVVVALLSLRPVTSNRPSKMPAAMPTTAPTGLTVGEIMALRNAPGGEAALARALLDAADAADAARPAPAEPEVSSNEPVLVYAWRQDREVEYAHAGGGWPLGVDIGTNRAVGAEEVSPPASWKRQYVVDRYAVSMVRLNAADPAERTTVRYSLAAGAKVAAALLILWYTIAAALAIWRRLLRRRDRRRARAGRCIPCGYDLRGG